MSIRQHKLALLTIAAAASLDALSGWVFSILEHVSIGTGLYWSVATATTAGFGDIVPHRSVGRALAVVVLLTVVPLFSATFSLFTASLMKGHMDKGHQEIKDALEAKQ